MSYRQEYKPKQKIIWLDYFIDYICAFGYSNFKGAKKYASKYSEPTSQELLRLECPACKESIKKFVKSERKKNG